MRVGEITWLEYAKTVKDSLVVLPVGSLEARRLDLRLVWSFPKCTR